MVVLNVAVVAVAVVVGAVVAVVADSLKVAYIGVSLQNEDMNLCASECIFEAEPLRMSPSTGSSCFD